MGQEIERKFLVKGIGYRRDAVSILIFQGYLSVAAQAVVRVRRAGDRAWLTVKSATAGISRAEFEYEIPVSDAEDMLALCAGRSLRKQRFEVKVGDHLWQVDEFEDENEGLVVAEVELSDPEESFEKPEWAGEEVSGDPRYFNSNLVTHPFRSWE